MRTTKRRCVFRARPVSSKRSSRHPHWTSTAIVNPMSAFIVQGVAGLPVMASWFHVPFGREHRPTLAHLAQFVSSVALVGCSSHP